MTFRILGLCRGDGKGYIAVSSTGETAARMLAVAITPEDEEIPCGVYEMPIPGEDAAVAEHEGVTVHTKDGERQFVVAVPLLNSARLRIRLLEFGEQGTKPVWEFPFDPLHSKVISRLTYRFRQSFAWNIRSIDQIQLSGQPYVYVTGIYPLGNDRMVCRFHATLPYDTPCEYESHLYGADGRRLACEPLLLEDNVVPDHRDPQCQLRELTYSAVLPVSEQTLCITVQNHENVVGTGCFTCLLPANTRSFLTAAKDGLKHASQDPRYPEWFAKHRATPADLVRQRALVKQWGEEAPLISIVTPVYRPKKAYFRSMIESILAQSYEYFELILVNASGDCSDVDEVLASCKDKRVRVITVENQGIVGNTNVGLEHCAGDYVAFVDHDDTVEPDALYRYMSVVRKYPETDVLYCDEDHLKEDHYEWPIFKPAYNPDLLYSHNYITHMLMVSRYALDKVSRSTAEVDGAQDYDLTLKCCEVARSVRNVPYVLYHWREHPNSTSSDMGSKPYAVTAGRKALQSHFDRCGIAAKVEERDLACAYRVCYQYFPKVSVIIPTKDHAAMLSTCIQSILGRTKYPDYEILCVENNSVEDATFRYYDKIQRESDRVHVVAWRHKEFNYSAICNFGASHAAGDILLFLNNDTEVIAPEWMASMVGFFARNDVGVVGAKLYNYDGLIQHGGIWAVPGGCFYINQNFTKFDNGYMNLLRLPSDCAAVTGACQMISRSVFDAIGGFDEELAVSFSDIDLCLKAEQLGYHTVFDPDAELFHRESSSRGRDDLDVVKQRRMEHEKFHYFDKWADLARGHFMNINLDQYDGHFKIAH